MVPLSRFERPALLAGLALVLIHVVDVALRDVNRVYRDRIGPGASLWTLPGTTHTKGLTAYPRAYEKRVVDFLDDALRANPADGEVS